MSFKEKGMPHGRFIRTGHLGTLSPISNQVRNSQASSFKAE